MKQIFTLLLSSLSSLSLLAYDGNRLSVSTVSNTTVNYKVEVDGRKYSMQDNTVTLRNLSEGSHNVRIYREKARSGNGFGFGRRDEIVYATTVFLRRGVFMDFTVNRFGKVLVDERNLNNDDDWSDYGDDAYDDGGWGNGYKNIMSARDFEMVKIQVGKEWLESNKMASIRTIVDKNNFSTQQVREMMQMFSMENNKLEVAKIAFRRTLDKENYGRVGDELSFRSSKDELARFIRESR